uniref:Uncharacterized protein n=1 Tax=Bactrocera latifrons TaxID=174628 RepID=A0A0K8VJW9_BACLA
MDTWAIMSQIKCGYVTLLDVYLQQEEARERREMFSRKLQKARARYELLHPNESDTDDDSYENETDSKRFCTESPHNNNNFSEKQDQPEVEPTDGLNILPTEVIEIDSDDDGDKQAKATKSQIIKKIWSQRGSENDLFSPANKSTSKGGRNVKSANKYVISPGDDNGIEMLEEKVEIVNLCTPPKANDSSVAEYQTTPTTSRKRFRKRRLNFTM